MTDLYIWKSICQNCKNEMFRGSIPGTFIYVQCPHCGDVWKVWNLPDSMPMLIRKWRNCVTIDDEAGA
jgi:hypothetical protein